MKNAKFQVGDKVIFESEMGVIKSDAVIEQVLNGISEPAYKIALAWPGGKLSPVFESELQPSS